MPALSPTMDVGTIASWKIQPGQSFSAGDILCSIETDKATVDFETQDEGVLAKILKQGDDARDLKVGTPICIVVHDVKDVQAFETYTEGSSPSSSPTTPSSQALPASVSMETSPVSIHRDVSAQFVLSPAARHMTQSKGVDATVLPGTGKGGRVTKEDVVLAMKKGVSLPSLLHSAPSTSSNISSSSPTVEATPLPSVATVPPNSEIKSAPTFSTSESPATASTTITPELPTGISFHDVANNNMRKVIAKRLTESKSTVPHFYTTMEVPLDAVLSMRKHLAKTLDVKVSVNDFIIRSSALALRDVPEVNSRYNPKTVALITNPSVDVSVAVATPTGLITPILFQTDKMGIQDISNHVKDLASRAREGKLLPEEYQGGTFCISNLGMFGISEFSAVINPPQAAILAVGGGVPTVVPTPFDEDKDIQDQKKPRIQTIMMARLSADRRVVDEATAALFLSVFSKYLKQPELLLL